MKLKPNQIKIWCKRWIKAHQPFNQVKRDKVVSKFAIKYNLSKADAIKWFKKMCPKPLPPSPVSPVTPVGPVTPVNPINPPTSTSCIGIPSNTYSPIVDTPQPTSSGNTFNILGADNVILVPVMYSNLNSVGITDLSSYQFNLNYDTTKLEFAGNLVGTVNNSYFFNNFNITPAITDVYGGFMLSQNSMGGTLVIAMATGNPIPISGNGILLYIPFYVLQGGNSTLTFTPQGLGNQPYAFQMGGVDIGYCTQLSTTISFNNGSNGFSGNGFSGTQWQQDI